MKHIVSDLDGVLVFENKMPKKIIKLLLKIQEICPISISTGRGLKEIAHLNLTELTKKGFLITENGSNIFQNKKRLKDWDSLISEDLQELDKLFNKINKKAYKEIKKRDKGFTIVDFKDDQIIKDNKGIKSIKNFRSTDFISGKAGKAEAITFLINKKLMSPKFYCIGDGDNDIKMIKLSKKPFTIANASKNVLKSVKERRGFISKKESVNGSIEILEKILTKLKKH